MRVSQTCSRFHKYQNKHHWKLRVFLNLSRISWICYWWLRKWRTERILVVIVTIYKRYTLRHATSFNRLLKRLCPAPWQRRTVTIVYTYDSGVIIWNIECDGLNAPASLAVAKALLFSVGHSRPRSVDFFPFDFFISWYYAVAGLNLFLLAVQSFRLNKLRQLLGYNVMSVDAH